MTDAARPARHCPRSGAPPLPTAAASPEVRPGAAALAPRRRAGLLRAGTPRGPTKPGSAQRLRLPGCRSRPPRAEGTDRRRRRFRGAGAGEPDPGRCWSSATPPRPRSPLARTLVGQGPLGDAGRPRKAVACWFPFLGAGFLPTWPRFKRRELAEKYTQDRRHGLAAWDRRALAGVDLACGTGHLLRAQAGKAGPVLCSKWDERAYRAAAETSRERRLVGRRADIAASGPCGMGRGGGDLGERRRRPRPLAAPRRPRDPEEPWRNADRSRSAHRP